MELAATICGRESGGVLLAETAGSFVAGGEGSGVKGCTVAAGVREGAFESSLGLGGRGRGRVRPDEEEAGPSEPDRWLTGRALPGKVPVANLENEEDEAEEEAEVGGAGGGAFGLLGTGGGTLGRALPF